MPTLSSVNALLPDSMRMEHSHALIATLDQAEANGWTSEQLAASVVRVAPVNAGAGLTVTILRRIARETPVSSAIMASSGSAILRPHTYSPSENAFPFCICGLPPRNRHHV